MLGVSEPKATSCFPAHPPGLVSKDELCKGRVILGLASCIFMLSSCPACPSTGVGRQAMDGAAKAYVGSGIVGPNATLPLPTLSFCQTLSSSNS